MILQEIQHDLPEIKGWYSPKGTKSTHIAPNQPYRKDLRNYVHIRTYKALVT